MKTATKAIATALLFYQQLQVELQQALTNLCQEYSTIRQGKGGTSVVDNPLQKLEWAGPNRQETEYLPGDRCLLHARDWGLESEPRDPGKREEQKLHINCLKLLGAFLAFKCFFKDKKSIHVLLKMDNTSAIAYITKMSPALNKLKKEFWLWSVERDISVQAQHIAWRLASARSNF